MKENCWDFMKCGREKKNSLGICPAATDSTAHSLNGGENGGRICWAVEGTFCTGEKQGKYAEKVLMCRECDFRWKVQDEEGRRFRQVYFRN
jgi:hypothetical protein